MQNKEIIKYESEDERVSIEFPIDIDSETVWLSQKQIGQLFGKHKMTINEHIKNVFSEGELLKSSTVRNFLTVQKEGSRSIKREVEHYNLDVVISVGYRVKSKRGTQFRQWAMKVLRNYIVNATEKRLTVVEYRTNRVENRMNQIEDEVKAALKHIIDDENTTLL